MISTYANFKTLKDAKIKELAAKEHDLLRQARKLSDAIDALQAVCEHSFVEYHIGGHNNEDVDVCEICGSER